MLATKPAGSSEFAGAPLVFTAGISYNDPNNVRFDTSLHFAELARDEGVPVVIVNGSPEQVPEGKEGWSPTWVADAHRERGAIVLPAAIGGIATQRQQGVAYAVTNGAEKVVGTESEKPLIVMSADKLSRALDDNDVLVIGRHPSTENTMPPLQQRVERLAGWILEATHELPRDALAGPRGFTVAGAEVLADYPATDPGMNNWIYLYKTPLDARGRGLRVGGIDASFPYPTRMVDEETGNPTFDRKRFDQFKLQLDYLLGLKMANPDIVKEQIAATVLSKIVEWTPDTPNEDMLETIAWLEDRFTPLGYQPAVRLQTR